MAKKSKGNRVQVILECTEQKESGVPGMSRYITTKNRKNTPERLELKKYNPYLKRVTLHREIKIMNYGKENRCNIENRRWSWLCKSNQKWLNLRKLVPICSKNKWLPPIR